MADPTIFEYLIEDDQGLKNRAAIYAAYDGTTLNVDGLTGAWAAYGGLIDPCIDGQITQGRVTIPLLPASGWKTAPATGNNVNQVMTLNFNNDFNTYLTALLLPSYKESTLNTQKRPNVGATPLSTLIAAIIAGSGSPPDVFPNSRDLHDLNALFDAFLTTRKVRNQKAGTRVIG